MGFAALLQTGSAFNGWTGLSDWFQNCVWCKTKFISVASPDRSFSRLQSVICFLWLEAWAEKAAALCITQACATLINHRSTVLQLHEGKTGWSLWHDQNDCNVCAKILMLLKRLLQRWYAPTCSRLRSSKQLWWAETAPKTAMKWQWDEVSLSEHTEILL